MARTYAGILGSLAFLTLLARGVLHAGPVEDTLLAAWAGLWAMAALGALVGWIAGRTVDEAVRARIVSPSSAQAGEPADA